MTAKSELPSRRMFKPLQVASLVLALSSVALTGCLTSETTIHGFVPTDYTLDEIVPGSSQEQVLLSLGTPSTTANFGNDVYYYISQTRRKSVAFLNSSPISQTVVAVYFDDEGRVDRTAKYGLKDGRLYDFTNDVTPTAGKEASFLGRMLQGVNPSGSLLGGG